MATPYEKAAIAIDEAHYQDPKKVTKSDREVPYELFYAEKMSHYLEMRCPDASPILRLAIRAQHLKRWEVPRTSYPMTKAGYYSWRTFLKKRQAEIVEKICIDAGMAEEDAKRVGMLVRKEDLKSDQETQVLEDVACLVFLDDQFEEFKEGYDDDKIVNIIKKTWVKMSPAGHQLALKIPMSEHSLKLVTKALGE